MHASTKIPRPLGAPRSPGARAQSVVRNPSEFDTYIEYALGAPWHHPGAALVHPSRCPGTRPAAPWLPPPARRADRAVAPLLHPIHAAGGPEAVLAVAGAGPAPVLESGQGRPGVEPGCSWRRAGVGLASNCRNAAHRPPHPRRTFGAVILILDNQAHQRARCRSPHFPRHAHRALFPSDHRPSGVAPTRCISAQTNNGTAPSKARVPPCDGHNGTAPPMAAAFARWPRQARPPPTDGHARRAIRCHAVPDAQTMTALDTVALACFSGSTPTRSRSLLAHASSALVRWNAPTRKVDEGCNGPRPRGGLSFTPCNASELIDALPSRQNQPRLQAHHSHGAACCVQHTACSVRSHAPLHGSHRWGWPRRRDHGAIGQAHGSGSWCASSRASTCGRSRSTCERHPRAEGDARKAPRPVVDANHDARGGSACSRRATGRARSLPPPPGKSPRNHPSNAEPGLHRGAGCASQSMPCRRSRRRMIRSPSSHPAEAGSLATRRAIQSFFLNRSAVLPITSRA